MSQQRFYVETLGCPKNQVDSDKLVGTLLAGGMAPTTEAADADLVVVNTCAFIESARQESIDTVLALDEQRRDGARLVVTGCMAERYGDELAAALPEVDQVAGFGVSLLPTKRRTLIPVSEVQVPELDLLNLPRPRSSAPWAYVKIAEGCDRSCGFCAIPSFRGPQRSRTVDVDPRPRSRSCRPGRSCSSPRTSRRTARTSPASSVPGPSSRSCAPSPSGPTVCGCSTCTRATCPTP